MTSKSVKAHMENLETIMDFIDQVLVEEACTEKVMNQIKISVEEIFTNIVSYAYPDQKDGRIEVACELREENRKKCLSICFRDWGIPYNPLERPAPDFGIPFEERPIGGLGIHMIRQFMDHMEYLFEDGCNQFLIQKEL